MSRLGIDIDEVVREVMRLLGSGDGRQQHDAGHNKAPPPVARIEIAERVVSVEQLDRGLDHVKQIVVRADAIVTPAAYDMLSEKGIEVLRSRASQESTAGGARISLAIVRTTCDATNLIQTLEKAAIAVESLKTTDLVAAIGAMTERATQSEPRGIILTGETAAALCLANRKSCLRGALATNLGDVAKAIESIGANLLVIDPAGRSLHELLQMIKPFAGGGPRGCPAGLRSSLA